VSKTRRKATRGVLGNLSSVEKRAGGTKWSNKDVTTAVVRKRAKKKTKGVLG